MKLIATIAPVIVAVGGSFAFVWAKSDRVPPAATTGVAVVELFTSEGCSSCPPADDALADLVKESRGHVYALAFHVDYWDRIGWADPFASPDNTARQQQYAEALKLDGLYTPQAIVNGSREFVGSNRAMLKAAVDDALAKPAAGTVEAVVKRVDAGISIDISTTGLPTGTIVNVAVVESGLSSDVTRGENRGHKLAHEHVVRTFCSGAIDDRGRAAMAISTANVTSAEHSAIVIYAQRPSDLRVLAATEVECPK